jgi:ribokinase
VPGLFLRVARVPRAGETVLAWDYAEPQDGGKGSNQAIAAARLGGTVSFVGCVGQDRLGDEGCRWLEAAGVDVRFLRRHTEIATGVGFILLDADGVPAMAVAMGANGALTVADVERALDALPDAGCLLTQCEIPVEVALAAAQRARARGLTAIVNPAPAPAGLPEGIECASLLVPNESEARALLQLGEGDSADPVGMAEALRRRTGVEAVLVTAGGDGVAGCDAAGTWHVPAPEVRVVDTSGAGDVFCAARAGALPGGASVRAAAAWACAAASLSVTRPGTIPGYPYRREVGPLVTARR